MLHFIAVIATLLQITVVCGASDVKPNFIIILTDDQDVTLNGMVPMKNTQRLLANSGITFTNAFTSSPLCCPSRASLLTGQYAHNHRTHNNSASGGCYSAQWRSAAEPHAMPVHFQRNGYRTFYAGKYLNEYRGSDVPPGWSEWYGLNGNSRYYNYTLTNVHGRLEHFGCDPDDYLTDVLGKRLDAFLMSSTTKADPSLEQPFLAVVAPPSAHAPFEPAPRHRDRFADVDLLLTPNFNRLSGELDKHWLLAAGQQRPNASLSPSSIERLRRINIQRWQTLLAVDEMVSEIVQRLDASGQLNSTYVLFTSDNGFHLGQFAQGADKRQPYEHDIRVPLVVRGPGIRSKTTSAATVALVDLLPTLLDLAGISPEDDGLPLDGVSFSRELLGNDDVFVAKRQLLVRHWGEADERTVDPACEPASGMAGCDSGFDCHCEDSHNNTYVCLRQLDQYANVLYCEFDDTEAFTEAYDLNVDPYQLVNIAYDMLPSMRNYYSMILNKLAKCVGRDCHRVYP